MKTIKLFVFLIIMLGFAVNTAQSQAIIVKDFKHCLNTQSGIYYTYETQKVDTPSGVMLFKATWHIDLDDPIVPDKGINKFIAVLWYDYEGETIRLEDQEMIVKANGTVTVIYHINGAGYVTPNNK
jgi:hypothetical protein